MCNLRIETQQKGRMFRFEGEHPGCLCLFEKNIEEHILSLISSSFTASFFQKDTLAIFEIFF